ncbi:MAG: hypothetical protein ACK55X_14830 [Synechococcaceae cyanobacterium]|jgi:predicted N-acetyltransferase YhbS
MAAKSKTLLLDTNLLLLYLVGSKDPKLIEGARRLNAFNEDDFDLLIDFIEVNKFTRPASTPHILTEASNLIGAERDTLKKLGREAIREYVQHCNEIAHEACVLVDDPEFNRLGLTDIAIRLASDLPAFVLTADHPLCLHLADGGVEVVNFNHIRQGSWS